MVCAAPFPPPIQKKPNKTKIAVTERLYIFTIAPTLPPHGKIFVYGPAFNATALFMKLYKCENVW